MKCDLSPAEQLVSLLREKSMTLAAAESCTGGWFSKRIVDAAGASAVFLGGVVSYTNEIKEKILGVTRETLSAHTAVSAPVAVEMAKGVRERFGADIGISVTGLAGPGGGTMEIPVGRVFIGIATEGKTEVLTLTLSGAREDVRYAATEEMLAALINRLS
jgi:nicotinamide-nucleotide amidase